ncbi:F-box/LRR-repeat protein [Tripterygium wilfordii]|uniref:F-box/LRR-repeat protein n=1 Tax=Tripterygium wilfordii TaxID=458696 RepID=A0A7J7C5I5_TRIWF|nr:F-box/FBD/LRR-repeat protein At5g56420-like [Tripterygium wilfordii]XP_038689520.1 F-box/FBD/LRR-repeat protein At5g56420-like [Tripterygium wilfordii]XP_038689521.1 F-box/FBD/LRR-repeat protein At5g56420-like [Tripterygium wilfordii]KAF5729026.1 F-box/LRR-repeat protein [Tripterygium wilfordii]
MQKVSERQDVDDSAKSLSKFPDVVLQHILSFLPTKDAIRTSVLSKRWEYLWTSIPNLEFNDHKANRATFMDFVDRGIALRKTDIKDFSLTCDVLGDESRIRRWVSAAVRYDVQTFCTDLSKCKESFELPQCLFNCASLRELHLSVSCTLKLPPSVCFSTLKILSLHSITFPDDHFTQKLFSGCPMLEDLWLHECNWVNVKIVSIYAPRLLKLSISEMEIDNHTWNESNGCQIMIFGNCLKYFYYIGELFNEYCFYNESSLDDVWIQMYYTDQRSRVVAYRLFKLLSGLRDFKELAISKDAVEVLNHAAELLAHMPLFNNLSILFLDWGQVNLGSKALLKILQNSPHLNSLVLVEGISFPSDSERILEPLPSCFLSHLKKIEVYEFEGTEKAYMDVAAILLKRTAALEKLVLSCPKSSTWTLEEKENVRNELLELPRALEVCTIQMSFFMFSITVSKYV